MVADEDRIETDLLGDHGKVQQLARAELLGGRLVAKSDQDGDSSAAARGNECGADET
jgi:hypothetical protein